MSRRAFTLMELLISTALTAIVVLFLYRALEIQERSNATVAKHGEQMEKRIKLYELLYADLIQARQIEVKPVVNKNYTLLFLHTTNSLHQIPFPYVAYFVHEKNRTLVRLESAYEFRFPVESERVKYIFSDALIQGVQKFIVEEIGSKGAKPLTTQKKPVTIKKIRSKEYLLFLKWPKEEMLIDIKKE